MIYGQPVTFGGASGEINITDNGTFDVKKYATANVDVAPVLLWTNASPSSQFSAQTVSFNANNYDALLLEARFSISDVRFAVRYVPFGLQERMMATQTTDPSYGTNGQYNRGVYNVSKTGIRFTEGASGTNPTNAAFIPTRIWGVKFTLE